MTGHAELSLRWQGKSARWWTAFAALAAAAAGVAAGLGAPDAQTWGILAAIVGMAAVGSAISMLRRRVEAGPDGLRYRTVVRWRRLAWEDIARFEDLLVDGADPRFRSTELRVAARLRDGSTVSLPVPWMGPAEMGVFAKQLSQLRALHRRYAPHPRVAPPRSGDRRADARGEAGPQRDTHDA
ncbi:PH domain-containing protein [Streptomyces montanisoli]|uniref:PH domain-containing protein n=1 Tax=Streptomyces montanisoli TaxID=2798581 RepID=A0A940RUB4_9ACTN|nr:PH domain-containing protein [Streptomyces montanisoli]MBP0457056.1 PH domain-containing protein [Streptomyces montanisoli]